MDMRPTRCGFLLAGALLVALVAMASDAVSEPAFPDPPPPGRFINDSAGVIGKEHAAEIDRMAAALLADRGLPISVVTVRSLAAQGAGGYAIERYALDLLTSWQDDPARAHRMLLLVAADDRKARIQLGTAWGNAHDERARRVMDRLILPAFRNGDLSAGILDGVRGFDAMGRQLPLPAAGRPSWIPSALIVEELDAPWWALPAAIAGALILIAGLVSIVQRGRRSWAWIAAAFIVGLLLARFLRGEADASESASGAESGAEGGATGSW
jgi:uncharacterized protein